MFAGPEVRVALVPSTKMIFISYLDFGFLQKTSSVPNTGLWYFNVLWGTPLWSYIWSVNESAKSTKLTLGYHQTTCGRQRLQRYHWAFYNATLYTLYNELINLEVIKLVLEECAMYVDESLWSAWCFLMTLKPSLFLFSLLNQQPPFKWCKLFKSKHVILIDVFYVVV